MRLIMAYDGRARETLAPSHPQLARVHDAFGVESGFEGAQDCHAGFALLTRQPGGVIAASAVVVRDGAAMGCNRV